MACMDDLPESVLVDIFRHVEPEVLFRVCSCVCRLWRESCLSSVLWKGFCAGLGVDVASLEKQPSLDWVHAYLEASTWVGS